MAVYLGEPLQEEQVVTFPELNLVWLRSTANAIVVANQVIANFDAKNAIPLLIQRCSCCGSS